MSQENGKRNASQMIEKYYSQNYKEYLLQGTYYSRGIDIENFSGDWKQIEYYSETSIDVGINSRIITDKPLRKLNVVSYDINHKVHTLGIDTSGSVQLSSKLDNGSIVSIDGIDIGVIDRSEVGDNDPRYGFTVTFLPGVTNTQAEALLHSLIYTNGGPTRGGMERDIEHLSVDITLIGADNTYCNLISWLTVTPPGMSALSILDDTFEGTESGDLIGATASTFNTGDSIDGKEGTDTLQLTDDYGIIFELSKLGTLKNVEIIQGTAGSDCILITQKQLADVQVVRGGGGANNVMQIFGSSAVLSGKVIESFSSIYLMDSKATVTLDNKNLALLVSTIKADTHLILKGDSFTAEEREQLHRQGIAMITDESTAENEAPTITVDETKRATPAIDDGENVNPFRGVTFDDDGDRLTVTITFVGENGQLILPTGVTPTSVDENDPDITYTFTGTAAVLNDLMTKLQFDSRDRPEARTGSTHETRFEIAVTDNNHDTPSEDFVVVNTTVNNRAPTDIKIDGHFDDAYVPENVPLAELGELIAIDTNADETFVYEFSQGGNPANRFKLVTAYGATRLALAGRLDYEAADLHTDAQGKYYNVVIVAKDQGGGAGSKSVSKTFKVYVLDKNDTPNNEATQIALSSSSVKERSSNSAEVGRFSAFDADGDAVKYTLVDDAGGRFSLLDNKLVVKDGAKLDFEQDQFHQITVLVSDGKASRRETFTIEVKDVVEDVRGTEGKNNLKGGIGSDKLYGDSGNDVLTGGAGQDFFVFNTALGKGTTPKNQNKNVNFDTITDFKPGEDKIWLDNAIFKKLGKGLESAPAALNKKFFASNKAKDKNDYLIYKKGIVYYDKDGSDDQYKPVEIIKIANNAKLSAGDFYVI